MKKQLTLVIGDKRLSSWSLRPWLLLKEAGIPFNEALIRIHRPDSLKKILRYSKAGRVPALIDGNVTVWESTAICEYLAEKFPKAGFWPKDPKARAEARSISHEMHAGFQALRQNLPFSAKGPLPGHKMVPAAQPDVDRITEIWRECRKKYGKGGPMLFGKFTIADAMYAPVAVRFQVYGVKLDPVSAAYRDTVLSLEGMQEWLLEGAAEA